MFKASKGAYVSSNFMEKYKAKLQKKKEAKEQKKQLSDSDSDDERNRSMCSVNMNDLSNDLNYSGDEMEMNAAPPKAKSKSKPGKVLKQEVDTNVFKICMSTLKNQEAELASGDPVICTFCQAVFNKFSKVEDMKESDEEKQVWTCEFCAQKNNVNLEPEEFPQKDEVNYIIEAAAQVQEQQLKGAQDISLIFCIDISGSMCVSQPIAGKHSLKGDKVKGIKDDLMKFSDGSDQRLQGESNVTYVSRMQCVQAAIDQQLGEMSVAAPNRKVGIVSFNHEVTVIGDGSKAPATVAGDKLNNYDFLMENGQKEGELRMQRPVKDCQKLLQQKLLSLEETGPTALGPALATSIAMAAQGKAGSSVVVCTDGLANVGLGAFDEIKSEEQCKMVDEFYERLGQFAMSKGITVSIISIEGEECNIDTLSKISEMTGGMVERVNPQQLTQNFSSILQLPVIATNVTTKIKLHKGLEFRNEDEKSLSEDKCILVRQLGNVTDETEITFEYRLKKIKDLVQMEDIDLTKLTSFPFQAQISYTSLDGAKCMRVISCQQPINNDREYLEKNANYQILSQNAIVQSSKMAKQGKMVEAQAYAKNWNRKMRVNINNEEQAADFQNYNKNYGEVYNMIKEQRYESDSEGEEEKSQAFGSLAAPAKGKKKEQQKGFFGKMGDNISAALFKAQKTNAKKFRKGSD